MLDSDCRRNKIDQERKKMLRTSAIEPKQRPKTENKAAMNVK